MQTEEYLEEIIVLDSPWYNILSTEDWVVLAIAASALTLGLLAWRQLQRNALRKAVLAGVSGLLCYAVYYFGFDGRWPSPLFHSVSGGLFAVGVLFPYLKYDKVVWLRGFGLIALSTLSYWSAIETFSRSSSTMSWNDTQAFVAASLVGAIIVLTGARFIAPLNRAIPLAVVGSPAAIAGGLAFSLANHLTGFLSFLAWHCLMASAIHIAVNWRWRTGNIE